MERSESQIGFYLKHTKVTWLVAYYIFCIAISAFSLNHFAKIIDGVLTIEYNYQFELCMVLGQVFFQWLIILKAPWEERFTYLFCVLSVSMIGSILLLPLIVLNAYWQIELMWAVIYFFSIVLVMFFVHRSLIKKVNLAWYLTYTWVLYRVLLLVYIIYPREVIT